MNKITFIKGQRPPIFIKGIMINERLLEYVTDFELLHSRDGGRQVLKVTGLKRGPDGSPYTVGGGYVAEYVEYYPVDSVAFSVGAVIT